MKFKAVVFTLIMVNIVAGTICAIGNLQDWDAVVNVATAIIPSTLLLIILLVLMNS